jgi:hypothetical protein
MQSHFPMPDLTLCHWTSLQLLFLSLQLENYVLSLNPFNQYFFSKLFLLKSFLFFQMLSFMFASFMFLSTWTTPFLHYRIRSLLRYLACSGRISNFLLGGSLICFLMNDSLYGFLGEWESANYIGFMSPVSSIFIGDAFGPIFTLILDRLTHTLFWNSLSS